MKQNTLLLYVALLCMVAAKVHAQKIPVTDKPFNSSDAIFRFAIVTDRTGGMQTDVFKEAIEKLELMQPEFVLSVGDLIDGYTEDSNVWNTQWDEFDAIVDKLEMPFYHVPGNHDVSNKLLNEAWRKRLGRDYYYFKYKDVLFVALNTDEIEGGGIGTDQIAYVQKVLKENTDVKWTLLFMHRPLWSYGDRAGYDPIEKALGDRPYTLFSGHHHHYRYKKQNGMDHFILATTGGGSYLRGADVGEFNHITWVTMKADGPIVANLELSGIYDKNVVNEADYADIEILRDGNWLNVLPLVNSEATFDRMPAKLMLKNTSEKTLVVQGKLKETSTMSFVPKFISDTLAPNTSKDVLVEIISKAGKTPVKLLNDQPVEFTMRASFQGIKGDTISLETSKSLLVDWEHRAANAASKPKKIDGNLSDWSDSDFISVSQPQFFDEGWDWKGPEDGSFKFAVAKDTKFLYVAIDFSDELTILENDVTKRQDKFYIHLDAQDNPIEIELSASDNGKKPYVRWNKGAKHPLDAAIVKTATGQILEMAIPLKALYNTKKPDAIRLNIEIMDHDRPENTKPSVLWWRPVWGSETDYKESGVFKFK